MSIRSICESVTVIPVLTIKSLESAVPMAEALAAGGLSVLEVTLRTEAGLQAIADIRKALPNVTVGAGTVLNGDQLKAAIDAGSQFGVSPGATDALLTAVAESGLPFLPGISTPSEAMRARDYGFMEQKLFPAEASGGIAMLKSLASPLSDLRYCPTGGVSVANAPTYLSLPNVMCVGGSWIAPGEAVDAGDWVKIRNLAEAASALSPS